VNAASPALLRLRKGGNVKRKKQAHKGDEGSIEHAFQHHLKKETACAEDQAEQIEFNIPADHDRQRFQQ
jgi:hypothetical protein